MQTKTNTPAEIAEDKLDEISGGPHFKTWTGGYDVAATEASGSADSTIRKWDISTSTRD